MAEYFDLGQENRNKIKNTITEFAIKEKYTQEELDLPIFFEGTSQILDNEDGYNTFMLKESELIKSLAVFFSSVSQIEKTELYESLQPALESYTSKIYGAMRFKPILTDVIPLSEKKFGDFFRLFQENIVIKVDSIEIRYLIRTYEALKRTLNKVTSPNYDAIGFISSIISNDLFNTFQSIDENILDKDNIKFSFLPKVIENPFLEKLETLTYFKLDEINDTFNSITWITTTYDYYNNSKLLPFFKKLKHKRLFVFSSGAINFLNYLEWRYEKNIDISTITFSINKVNSLIYLAKYNFDDKVNHFQIVGESFVIAILNFQRELLNLKSKKIILNVTLLETSLSEEDIILINFYKLYAH